MEDQLWRYKRLTKGQLYKYISTSSRKLAILFFCMRKVRRKSSGTSSCGTIRLEVSLLIRCNIFLCGKTKRLKDMRCLNVPPEVMVRFVFMMSTTLCAKMRVRNMIIGMMHIYNILVSMSMVKNIMKTCSVTLTLPHSQPACSSFQCPI